VYEGEPYELVLASDVLYERRNLVPVACWIRSALAPNGVALVSDSNRSAAQGFADVASAAGLDVDRLPREMIPTSGLVVRGIIYKLMRRTVAC